MNTQPAVPDGPPAGWYPDPMGAHGMERCWDGSSWTDEMRSATAQSAPPPDPATRDESLGDQAPPSAPHGVGGFYHRHEQAIDAAAGIGLIADGAMGNPLSALRGERRTGRITGSLSIIFVGLAFVVAGVFLIHYESVPAKLSAAANGTIMALHPVLQSEPMGLPAVGGGQPTTMVHGCRPVAAFVVNAHTYTATTTSPVSPCPYSTGEHITVRYDPSTPSIAQIPSGAMVPRFVPSVCIGLGVVLAIFGVLGLLEAAALISGGLWFLSKARRE